MSPFTAAILTILVAVFALSLTGCDVTAERELKRAETAIEEARDLNAEEHATEDYLAAEGLLVEAVELARDDRVQEARYIAIKAKLRAEDAANKAQERMRILGEEMRKLGR